MPRWGWILCGCVVAAMLGSCLIPLSSVEATVVGSILFGWAGFLIRAAAERTIDWGTTATALVCLGGFTVGLHWVRGWWVTGPHEGDAAFISRSEMATLRLRRTAALAGLVVLMFVSGIAAVGTTHQLVWLARSPELVVDYRRGRTVSTNNLKQMVLAAHWHHDVHKPGATFDSLGRSLHGWQTHLLPYLEQEALHRTIDLTVPWNHPRNQAIFARELPVFHIPDLEPRSDGGYALSHYSGNMRVFATAKPWRLQDMTDGAANTILMGEAAGNYPAWGTAVNWRDPALGLNRSADSFGRPGKLKGAMFAMADGTVRFFPDTMSPHVLTAFSTPAGGDQEGVTLPD